MPLLVSRANGNFTSASTWGVADSATGSQLTNPSANTTTTTSYVYSSTFTGTNTKVADGVALFMQRVNTTGTFSVALSDNNGVTATREVTVNASDLPASSSWVFFKFATTLTLDGGADYRVGVRSDTAGNVRVYRDATAGNWGRIISTTDTAAPAAGDTMLIVGELTGAGVSANCTVTMDNTATTDFGNGTATATLPSMTNPQNFNGIQIGDFGNLIWGTTAATNYYLKLSGNLIVWDGGTYNMGTAATPCPRDSTMYLQFDCVSDGDFGFISYERGTVVTYGQSRSSGKNVTFCKLNANAVSGATSLTVDTDTGWLDNDEIAVAPTGRTRTEISVATLNGNAGASTLTVDGGGGAGGGLLNSHDGYDIYKAEVVLLTRNVRISGASATVMSYFYSFGSLVNCNWTDFLWLGYNAASKEGLNLAANFNPANFTADFTIDYCCIRDGKMHGVFQSNSPFGITANIRNSIFYGRSVSSAGSAVRIAASSGGPNISNNVFMFGGSSTYSLFTQSGSFSNNIISASTFGWLCNNQIVSISNSVVHSVNTNAIVLNTTVGSSSYTFTNNSIWRINGTGITLGGSSYIFSSNNFLIADTSAPAVTISGTYLVPSFSNLNITFTSGFAWNQNTAILVSGYNVINIQDSVLTYRLNSIQIGTTCIIKTSNTLFGSPTEVANTDLLLVNPAYGYVTSARHDQTDGAHRTWFNNHRIDRDNSVFRTAAPSERLTGTRTIDITNNKSSSRLVAVDSGTSVTVSVYVTGGSSPARLILKKNPSLGIPNDITLATYSGSGWQQLSGTSPVVSDNGVLEFCIEVQLGSGATCNIDDWSIS